MVRNHNHILLNMAEELHAIQRTRRLLLFQDSSGASIFSAAPPSPTSSPQDPTRENSAQRPAKRRTQQDRSLARRNLNPNLLRKHTRVSKKISSRKASPKVIYTDNSLEFGKACEDLLYNHCTSTPHLSETNGSAERLKILHLTASSVQNIVFVELVGANDWTCKIRMIEILPPHIVWVQV